MLFLQVESAMSDQALKLADSLMEQGSYGEAVTEYKRFIFFNPEAEHKDYAFFRMGLAYRARRDWQKAIDALKASIRAAKDSTMADERKIVLAATFIASGNYSLARLELLGVSEPSEKSLYFDGIASLYMFDWNAVEKAFGGFYSEYAGGRMTKRAEEINSILLEARQSYKSVGLAKFLSTVLPGLGQFYAGDWRDALNALALNSLTIGLTANAIRKKDYLDIALMSSISTRYYLGNRYCAEKDVRKRNESLDRQNALRILNLVSADEP